MYINTRPPTKPTKPHKPGTAGKHGNFVVSKCVDKEFGFGFNAQTLTYGNLLESGVLDAATVTENALQNSVSIASLVLTSGVRWVWAFGGQIGLMDVGMDGTDDRHTHTETSRAWWWRMRRS